MIFMTMLTMMMMMMMTVIRTHRVPLTAFAIQLNFLMMTMLTLKCMTHWNQHSHNKHPNTSLPGLNSIQALAYKAKN